MEDTQLLDQINQLSEEEETLYRSASGGEGLSETEKARLRQIQLQLDQSYDLLRQRQARRSAGLDPDAAKVRPVEVVEHYEQ